MRALHHPSSCACTALLPVFLFVASTQYDRLETSQMHKATHRVIVVTEVQAQLHCSAIARSRAHHVDQRGGNQLHVMPVGRRYFHRQRNATAFSEQTALDATFGAVAWIGTGFFPLPAALSSSSHPAPASSSRCPSFHRIPAIPAARTLRTHLHRSIPGTVDTQTRTSRCRCRRVHSTACRCAAPAKSHPSPPGLAPAAGGIPVDAASAPEATAPSAPTIHRTCDSRHPVHSLSWLHLQRKSSFLSSTSHTAVVPRSGSLSR